MNVVIISIASILLSLFLATSSYWIIISVSRIYRFKKYRRVAVRHLSTQEESGYIFEQWCYHYETEILKYVYFLLINLTEIFGAVMALIAVLASEDYMKFSKMENIQKSMLSNCSSVASLTVSEFQLKQSMTILNVIIAFQNVADLFVVVLGVNLMSYLTRRIKRIQYPRSRVRIWISILSTISISLIVIGLASMQNLFLLHTILFPTTLLIYFCIFLRAVKQFERTLLQRAGERLAQFGSNKEEYQQYKHFKYTMRIICFGLMLIVITEFLNGFPQFLTSILFYPKCYFPLNFFPHYPIITTAEYIEILLSILFLLKFITGFLGAIVASSPFIGITVYIWINQTYKFISGKSKVKYSYSYHTEQLFQSLLDAQV